jgi:hypothetical protein
MRLGRACAGRELIHGISNNTGWQYRRTPGLKLEGHMAKICVIHLVRASNGVAPVRQFLESIKAHPAGVEHDLLVVFKGFGEKDSKAPFHDALAELRYESVDVSDEGFDLSAYFKAAKGIEHEYVCFMNSYSQVMADDWLAKLYSHASKPGVGVAGATGSWASPASLKLKPGEWFDQRPSWLELPFRYPPLRTIVEIRCRLFFDPFPNAHIRTNAFMLKRALFLGLERGSFGRKSDALRFESGKKGLTRQIVGQGLSLVVVGRDGTGYVPQDWARSRTFCQGNQENLLVADNRTQDYARGSDAFRKFWSEFAWGPDADPARQESSTERNG